MWVPKEGAASPRTFLREKKFFKACVIGEQTKDDFAGKRPYTALSGFAGPQLGLRLCRFRLIGRSSGRIAKYTSRQIIRIASSAKPATRATPPICKKCSIPALSARRAVRISRLVGERCYRSILNATFLTQAVSRLEIPRWRNSKCQWGLRQANAPLNICKAKPYILVRSRFSRLVAGQWPQNRMSWR